MNSLDRKTWIGCCLLPLLAIIGLGSLAVGVLWLLKDTISKSYSIGLLITGPGLILLTYVLYRRLNASIKKDLSPPGQITTEKMLQQGFVLLPKSFFSDRLRNYLQKIEVSTNRTIRIFDRRAGDKIGKEQEMPNAGPPPFYLGNTHEIAIDIFATPGAYSKEEAESSIALLATKARYQFDGLPLVRFNPLALFSKRGSVSEVRTDADPLQKWLSSTITSILSENSIIKEGFSRRTTQEGDLQLLEIEARGGSGYSLSTKRGTIIFRAINLAHVLLQLQEDLIPGELVDQFNSILEKIRQQNSQVLNEAHRIVAVLNQHNWKNPQNFRDCLLVVLQLWDIDEFVEFGHIDPISGRIIDD